jgi:hypothetical protein
VATLPGAVAIAVFLAVFAAVRDRLPERLAVHMDSSGRADDFAGQGAGLAVGLLFMAGLAALFGLLSWYAHGAGAGARIMSATGSGMAAFQAYLWVMILLANADATDPATVRFPMWHLPVGLASGVGVATLGWFLAGADRQDAVPADRPPPEHLDRLRLGPREDVAWTSTVNSKGLWAAGGGAIAVGVVPAAQFGWWVVIPAIVFGALVMAMARVKVTVDARGLTVGSAVLPAPRYRLPLEQIAAASTRPVNALRDFGGWGYRVRKDASGIIMRSGDALAVRKASGSTFVVTVDDAATAAATLNALADRAHRSTGSG